MTVKMYKTKTGPHLLSLTNTASMSCNLSAVDFPEMPPKIYANN